MSDILPSLAEKGLVYVTPMQYSQQQIEYLSGIFNSEIFPLLTPLRTDVEAFPHIKNLTTYAAFLLKPIAGIKVGPKEFKGSDKMPRIAFVEIPEGISLEVPSNTELFIKGIDKQLIGKFAAEVRDIRSPEPYKGKGIRYTDEHVRLKEGKKASK